MEVVQLSVLEAPRQRSELRSQSGAELEELAKLGRHGSLSPFNE